MLSKKDLKEIRTIVQEELKEALTIKIQYEKYNKEKGMKELMVKDFHLSVWLAEQFPDLVGALRGMQKDTGKTNNRILTITDNLKIVNKTLLDSEKSFKVIAAIGDKIKEIQQEDIIEIESKD